MANTHTWRLMVQSNHRLVRIGASRGERKVFRGARRVRARCADPGAEADVDRLAVRAEAA